MSGHGEADDERLDSVVSWVRELELQVQAVAAATDPKALKELRKTLEALSKRDPKFEERLTNKVDVVADRLQTLATTVSTTAAALAAREGEVAALRRELETGSARVDAAVAEARRAAHPSALEELRRDVSSLSEQKLPRRLDERVEKLAGAVEVLGQRVDTLSSTLSETASGLAGREGDVAGLRRQLEDESARLEATIRALPTGVDRAELAEVRDAVTSLARTMSGVDQETRRRVVALGVDLEGVAKRLDALAEAVAAASSGRAAEETTIAGLRQALAGTGAKLASLEDGGRALGERVDELGRRLEVLAGTIEDAVAGYVEKEADLVARSDRFEVGQQQVASLVQDLQEALRTMLERRAASDPGLLERVAALEQWLEERVEAARSDASPEEGQDPLSAQVDELAHRIDAVRGAVEEAVAGYAERESELVRRSERFEAAQQQVASLVQDLQAALQTMPATPSGPDPGLVARLEERLEAMERAHESLGAALARLDYLASRLDALESADGAVRDRSEPGPGDGRQRMELRRLELRMDHAEAAARENREAVLVQLERLASRIEWRLQELESSGGEKDPAFPPAAVGGDVVPIRGTEV